MSDDERMPWDPEPVDRDELFELAVERGVMRWLDKNADRIVDRIAALTAERLSEGGIRFRASRAGGEDAQRRRAMYAAARARSGGVIDAVVAAVERAPGMGRNQLQEECKREGGFGFTSTRNALRELVASGRVHFHPGANRSTLYFLGPDCTECAR